jgi:hypothetical protein
VERLAEKVTKVIILFNNTTGGKAVANALQFQQTLTSNNTARIPETTLQAFPYMRTMVPKASTQVSLPIEEVRNAV